jgi:DNA polymerase-3 subunit epsilon
VYAATVDQVVEGLTVRPATLLDPLGQRLAELADARRYEEAALVRDRAGALAAALRRQRGLRALAASGRVRLRLPGGVTAELMDGILLSAGAELAGQGALPFDAAPPCRGTVGDRPSRDGPPALAPEVALELVTVATWLDREAHRVRLEACDGVLASAWPAIPTFSPGQPLAPPKRLVA